MESFRKAYGALKDSTKVGLAKVNSEFKDLDIAIVKATNHVESPPKERHVAMIFAATSVTRPRADVAYCIHALSRRLAKTRNWIVALKSLIVIHRVLREGDPTFKEELLHFSHRGHIFQISNFKDESSPLAWDCSAWVRTYGLFLEERLECFRNLKYDIDGERLTKTTPGINKVHSRTRLLNGEELLNQLPALQQLLYRLIGCQPEGGACYNFLIQYALALVLKESFKIYCAINDGIINLVDFFFEMSKHDAMKALNIYKRAGKQAESLAHFYDFCRGLDLARTFQFPVLKQPPASFLATMEEYIKEAPQTGSMSSRRLEYRETKKEAEKPVEPILEEIEERVENDKEEEKVEVQEEPEPEIQVEETPPTDEPVDLLGLNQVVDPKIVELEESNALALAIIQPENPSASFQLSEIGSTSGWELALVTASSSNTSQVAPDKKLAGGFDKLLLDSLYEDDATRRQIQLQNAGYSAGYGYEIPGQNPFNQHDPFAMSNNIAPPTNVQMAIMSQQQQQQQQQQLLLMQQQQYQQYPQQNMMMVSHSQYQAQQIPYMASANPFGDPFSYQSTSIPPKGNHSLL